MLDRLTSLEVFAKVAANGSLSGAARTMGLSQTMVTKHVASLEARLGIKLFHRTTRRLSITEAGRLYLESSERILADMETADAAVARAISTFKFSDPSSAAPALTEGLRLTRDVIARSENEPDVTHVLRIKERQFEEAINAAHGLELSAMAEPNVAVSATAKNSLKS